MKTIIPLLFLSFLLVGAGCSKAPASDGALDAFGELAQPDLQEDEIQLDGSQEEGDGELQEGVEAQVPADDAAAVEEIVVDDEPKLESEDEDSAEQDVQDLPEEEADDEPEALSISMESGNFFFSPDVITAEPGQEIIVTIEKNSGTHTFVIDEIGFKESISSGDVMTFSAPSEPGSYAYYCDVGSHRALGMEGTLIVK